jgi:hypothetical protein
MQNDLFLQVHLLNALGILMKFGTKNDHNMQISILQKGNVVFLFGRSFGPYNFYTPAMKWPGAYSVTLRHSVIPSFCHSVIP